MTQSRRKLVHQNYQQLFELNDRLKYDSTLTELEAAEIRFILTNTLRESGLTVFAFDGETYREFTDLTYTFENLWWDWVNDAPYRAGITK